MKIGVLVWLLVFTMTPLARTNQGNAAASGPTRNLMPVPAEFSFGSGRLAMDAGFRVALSCRDVRLKAYIERAIRRLAARMGIQLNLSLDGPVQGAALRVECSRPGESLPALGQDESYELDVVSSGAVLKSGDDVGAMRGIETFLQLVEHDHDGYFIPEATIRDRPRFQWRGLLIDVARHFEPVPVLKRNLDAMAAVKLNVLHWHLTDDQGFRVESKKFPELTRVGSDGLFYTQEEVRDIISYAAARGIRVMPEFDMPGHCSSLLVSHPGLASAPGPYSIQRNGGIFEPALDPTRKEVYHFLDEFLGEMSRLFPDAYMHIGGDENEGKQWDRNPEIQAFMKRNKLAGNRALQAYFNKKVFEILKKHGKKMAGWEEIMNPDLPQDIVVQSWRGPASLAEATAHGYHAILSAGYYIDLMYPASQHYAVDPLPATVNQTQQQASLVLGGEATMWGEYVSPETIDSRIWPRTAAIAERLWSPASVTDVRDMYRRLASVSIELDDLGLTHEKNVLVMIRRLAGIEHVAGLSRLIDAYEPVKGYDRSRLAPLTMLTPLTNIVDIARPDSARAREFAGLVEGFLADAPRFQVNLKPIKDTLNDWMDIQPRIAEIAQQTPALAQAGPLAVDLSDAAGIALDAVNHLSAGQPLPGDWSEKQAARLKEIAQPRAAVELAIVPPVQKLVEAAANIGK